MTRYHALLRVCDMACAHAAATADRMPEFFATLAEALTDDCPMQAQAAARTAALVREAMNARSEFLKLVAPTAAETNHV